MLFISALSSRSRIASSPSSSLLLKPSAVVFSLLIIFFRFGALVFSYIFCLLLKFLLCSLILLSSVSFIMIIILDSKSAKSLIYISLMFSSGFLSCSFVWKVFLCILLLSDSPCLCLGIKQNSYLFQARSDLV